MGLSSLGVALKALPFKKPTTFRYVADMSDATPYLYRELIAFLESVNYKQFKDRHTTQYLTETNGFFLRTCGNLLPYNIDTGKVESAFSVSKRFEKEFPYAGYVIERLSHEADITLTRWGYSILEPGARVLPHIDNTTYLYIAKRCMVELAETDYEFYVEDELTPGVVGSVYEFNNNSVHYGVNPSGRRYGLIFDWVPNSWRP